MDGVGLSDSVVNEAIGSVPSVWHSPVMLDWSRPLAKACVPQHNLVHGGAPVSTTRAALRAATGDMAHQNAPELAARRVLPQSGVSPRRTVEPRLRPSRFPPVSAGADARAPGWLRPPTADRDPARAGEPLDAEVRRQMEAQLATDLGEVRIHTGSEAAESARSLNARAYTVGSDIVFGAGQYSPSTSVGRHVLGHELAHVVQQGHDGAAPARRGPAPAAAEREAHDVGRAASGTVSESRPVRPNPDAAGHIQRFDSFEHIQLGDTAAGGPTGYILLDCHARDLPGHATPTAGWPPDWIRRYAAGTPEQRRAITKGLTYGEIVAFSGDMYADIDSRTMATSVAGTMQRINKASLVEIYDLIPLLHSRSASTGQLEDATGGRYISLAARNVSHFANVSGGRNNISVWREGHAAALALAAAGNASAAWAMNAAADHFLTDAFAAGHLRPDRAEDVKTKRGNIRSKVLHDLDNEYGVAVHNLRGDHWIQYGDDHLNVSPDPVVASKADRFRFALEAVEASKAEIQTTLTAAARHQLQAAGIVPPYAAERLVPIVDTWSAHRWGRADVAAEYAHLGWTELPEQVVPNGDTRAREWAARQPVTALRDMPVEEKRRMVNRMLSGWVSDDDLDGVERLYRASTQADQALLHGVIGPQIEDLWSIRQRTRLRVLLSSPAGQTGRP